MTQSTSIALEPSVVTPAGQPRELRSSARDVQGYHRAIVIRCALMFGTMVLCALDALPLWSLWLSNLVLYPEVYLRVHDIGHGTPARAYGWAARFIPTSNPIWGGTRVFAAIHQEHHKYLGTNRDPWQPYYLGHPLRALFFNLIEPEYSCREFIKRFGVEKELRANFAFNAAMIAAGLAAFQWVYLVHMVSQRIVHGIGIFFFNFYAHRKTLSASAPIGTWERAHDLRHVLPLLRAVWGNDTIDGLIYHNRHHCLGQQHIPVKHYKYLKDSGKFTRYHSHWPIPSIRQL